MSHLFLHVSLGCLSESYEELDPLFFEGVTAGHGDGEQRRVKDLVDAFNAVKQDLVAARYLLWLASGDESPIRDHAAATSQRVGFLDSLMYARWGVRTGIAVQAFAAATNLLDKVRVPGAPVLPHPAQDDRPGARAHRGTSAPPRARAAR